MPVGVRGLLLGLLLALCGSVPECLFGFGRAVAQQGQQQAQALRVGTYASNVPWEFRDEKGELVGFDIDFAREIGRSLGRRVEIEDMAFRDLFTSLAENRIDVAVCSVSITPERTERFDFTQPYYDTAQGILVLKKAGLRDLQDLAGKTIGVTAGTTNERWLVANAARYGFGRLVFPQGSSEAVEALSAGSIDAYFGDLPTLLYQLLKRPDLAVIGRRSNEEKYGVMLAKHSALTDEVDAAITKMKLDGTLARIHRRWFGMAPDKESATAKVMPRP
jgi:polar amino acid transport system substrate-binding protein